MRNYYFLVVTLSMLKDLYYELTDNGYHIYDRNDPLFHIHQYEPYIPDKTKSYEENAKAQIHEFMVAEYISKIVAEEITIDDVPEDCKADLKADVEAALAT